MREQKCDQSAHRKAENDPLEKIPADMQTDGISRAGKRKNVAAAFLAVTDCTGRDWINHRTLRVGKVQVIEQDRQETQHGNLVAAHIDHTGNPIKQAGGTCGQQIVSPNPKKSV